MTINWPPNKAFTSSELKFGFRHFVATNYGGNGNNRWVTLVAVLDGQVRFLVSWEELKNNKHWKVGWLDLARDEANPPRFDLDYEEKLYLDENKACLHPSVDSGLLIPIKVENVRPWVQDNQIK